MTSLHSTIDDPTRRRLEALFDGTPVGSFASGGCTSPSQLPRQDNAKRLNAFLDGLVIEPTSAVQRPAERRPLTGRSREL